MSDRTMMRLMESRLDELAGRIRQLEDQIGGLAERSAPAEPTGKKYMTVAEAAEYTRLSESLLNRWRCDLPGGPHYIKVGARVLYAVEDLDALMAARRHIALS